MERLQEETMSNVTAIHESPAAGPALDSSAVIRGVLIGGLVAGLIDIGAATVINHVPTPVILQAIASGLLGKASFHGGAASAAAGFVLQLGMSLIIAAVYGVASARLPALVRRPITMGALYGVGVFIVMNFVVVPLSAAHMKPKITLAFIALNLAAMIVFGLIVALSQAWSAKTKGWNAAG
jgi:uncharacterized membrane protein YagU involved in acid resistance